MTEDYPIKLKVEDRVAHFILDKPPENRMNKRFLECMCGAIHALKCMDIGAIVIYGSGRHFSAGADVDYIKNSVMQNHDGGKDAEEGILTHTRYLRALETLEVPSIAAINGLCMGSGLEIALACDIRIFSGNSLLGSPELSWGIITGLGGSLRLERLIGRARAKEMLLRGDVLSGEEAYGIGLVNKVVGRKEVLQHALNMAKLFAQKERSGLNALMKSTSFLR